ncbi:uncharacterized protein KY384_000325 [Bacidia gigantensis]|uniref:uncharacterized protein n=1 Tax=Bacidia gigantensis TaxID=2732470 RepID=UPI001D047622|nr:uncharacterized protein KY384_000325 [Bacidia gigantensis]KAG8526332.1 hypothetical protein KY384_000325 [Bacidia gigantensis]
MSETHTHTDSLNGADHDPDLQKKVKSRRPASTYRTSSLQNLITLAKRMQLVDSNEIPILTPKTVLPLFFAIGIIFAPIGGLLLYASAQVQEIVLDYSDCHDVAPNGTAYVDMLKKSSHSSFKYNSPSPCTKNAPAPQWKQSTIQKQYGVGTPPVDTQVCSLRFNIPDNLQPPVLFYYRLTNFYQNHRRYVKSLDSDQLKGKAIPASTIKGGSCDPLRLDPDGKPYYPCGLIANSLFNDSFSNPIQLNVHNSPLPNVTYNMTNKGIAWSSDSALYGKTNYKLDQIAVPPNWHLKWQNGYSEENPPLPIHDDENFHVWMRTAGLPAFSKLAMRNDKEEMKCSTYQVDIENNFPVNIYGGTKSIVISTRTVMGGKNPFLGIAYVAVGGICIVLGAIFTVTHMIKPRKLGDHTYLSWNNDQPSTATATGIQRPGQIEA